MATEGVIAEVAPEKPVQEETGELSGGQCPGPLKLEKELSGNVADNAVSEIDEKVKVDLLNGTKIEDVNNIDCGALIRTANQSISEDPSRYSKAVQSIYLGNSGCSESEDVINSPLNTQVSLDEKIIEGLNANLDEEKPFEMEKEMVKSDTLCQNDNIGEMKRKDESTERQYSSEANEKETCNATQAGQITRERSPEREKEAKVQYDEALERASRQQIIGNNVEEVPPLAVKGLECLNLQKEELDNEIAFSEASPEVQACNKLEVFEINKEASNRHIDQKCEKIVHEYGFTAERMVKDEEKKLDSYSSVESEGNEHAVSEKTKDECDTAQENEAEVHKSILNPPTLQESQSNHLKDELCSYETDKASDMDQKKNVDILAHIIAIKQKYEDCSLLDDGTQEKNTVSYIKEKNKKSDELQERQNASEDISDSMASHVTNPPSVENKIKDTEVERIQMDGAIQQTGIGEEGTNNGFKLNNVQCANDETIITKVDTEAVKVEDGLNLASETKQPETIEANDKILKGDRDAGEEIHNVHHFVSKCEGHLQNSQCSTEVALQNDEGQKVEVKEFSESLPDERILASTAMSKTKNETTTDRTELTADTLDEPFQCDEIVDEVEATSQGREENESVTMTHLREVEHKIDQEVSSTACKEVDGSTVEDKKKLSSSDIELYAEDISKTNKQLDMETEKSQDRYLSEDHKLEDGNIIKSIDAERTKENTSVQGGETAEYQEEQSPDKNQEIITLDHGIQNENTTDAKEFDTSSSAESTREKCLLDKHQENEKTEAIPEIIQKEDKFYKEKDIDEMDSKADECKNLHGSDSHSEESLKQTDVDCESSKTETQQNVGLANIESSAREKVNEGVPKSNTEKCKDTKIVNLVACEQKDGDDQKHDNHPKILSLRDETAQGHTCTEKEQIYKEPSCSKQEEETGSDKHKEETGELIIGCQETSNIENLDEQTKNTHTKEEMRNDWTIIERERKKTNDLTEEDKTQEENPDRGNAILPVTYESVSRTLEEEEDIMQKEVPGSDTQETIHETTNTNMTIGIGCENDEKSPVEPQPTLERTEEDESITNVPLKEQSEPETDQEASSTVSKDVGRITDDDAQNKVYPETELCAQDISEDDREVTVHDDEISVPSEHLPFNENMTTLVGDEVLKVAAVRKFETSSSVQFPEDECLLNEHEENKKVAATSKMIQQKDISHKVRNLYEVDSHDKKCNMLLITDPQADESSEHTGPDYGQFQTDTQEDCKLIIIESSERVKMNHGALKSNAEHKEHKEVNDEGNSKADILIDETDAQMFDNHPEPLSLEDEAAGDGMYTAREHIYKGPKCSEVLDIISHEGKGEGDKLEEEAGKQTLNNHESSKQDNSSEETKNALTKDTKEVTVPDQDSKKADDVKVTNEEPMDDSNAHLNITNELVEEAVKQTLNHQESSKQDNLSEDSEEPKNALKEDTKEDTVSEPQNKRTEDLKETNEKHMGDSITDLSVTNELVEEAVEQTLDNQSSKHDNLSEETKNALTEETKEVTVPEMTRTTDNLKETNEEYTGESNAHLSVTNESVKEAVKETLDSQESSKQDNLSEETKTALTKETKEVIVQKQENNITDDLKQTNEEYTDESDTQLNVTNELVEEAVKQTLDNQESSKKEKLSEETEREFTEDTKEATVPEQENKRTEDIKLTNENHMNGSSAKQTLDSEESSEKDILSEETQNALTGETEVVTVSEQENKRTNELKETNEEHTDESDAHISVTNELVDEEAVKQTLDIQESSKQGNMSEETQNALAEETKEVIVPEQETKRTDDVKETNEEHTEKSIVRLSVDDDLVEEAVKQTLDNQESKSRDNIKETNKEHTGHLSVTDELVENAVKQTLDKQGGSKQDDLSEEAKDALTEETKEVTVIEQENKITDSVKVSKVEDVYVSNAHLNVTNELVEEARKQTLDNQESSQQDNFSTETKVTVTEESKEVTVQLNKCTDDLKESNEEHLDESNDHLDATDELVGESVKEAPNNQETSEQDNLSEETKIALVEETKEVTVPKQKNMGRDDLKEINACMDERNTHLNVIDELVGKAVKQTLENQESSKQDNLSEETKDAPTEDTKEVIVPKQENKRTDDIKVTIEEHMDDNNAELNVIGELDEVAGKQTLDSQESTKQDNLSGETKKAHTEQTNVIIVPEQENKGTYDFKETNEEHTDDSNAHLFVTDEFVEEADKQTLDNAENSKQDSLCEETKNALTEESKEVTVPEQEKRTTNDLKETNEEHTDESNPCLSVTNELVEEAVQQTLNNQKRCKQDNLSEDRINALTEETKEVTVPEQENKRTDGLKETNEEHINDGNPHLSVTNELAEEAVKHTCGNQESTKQDQLSEDTQKASLEGIKELTIPEQQNKKTDDLKENDEREDQSNAHLTVTDELMEETLEEAGTMQRKIEYNKKQVIHETTNDHVAVETKSFHAAESQFYKDTVGYKEGSLKAVTQSDENREHLPFGETAASVETCFAKEDRYKELDFSKITERNKQEEEADSGKLQEEANYAHSDKDHEPLPFGDATASRQTCSEKEDACKKLDCFKVMETNTQEEEDHEPLSFGDATASVQTCTEKEDTCKESDCSKIIETNTQEEEVEEEAKLQEEANGQPTQDQENSKLENLDRDTENAHVKEEKNQDIATLEQEKKRINDFKEEYITDEENPDKSNALSSETLLPAEKTQEEDMMQKENPTSDTEETVNGTPDTHMTPGSKDENHEMTPVEFQATYRKTEEDESTSCSTINEEDESSREQKDSSTVSKERAGNTDRATQNKTYPKDKLCTQEISKDNNEPDVQKDKTLLPLEQLTFDKNQEIINSADVELLKEETTDAEKYETSSPIQSTEDKCLLNEHQENEKPAVTAKTIHEKDQSHRDLELYEGGSHANKCNTSSSCIPDSRAERRSEKINSDYEPFLTDPQEYNSLATMGSSEREEFNRGTPKWTTEKCEHIADNEAANLKAVTQDERDGQKLHNHHEPLSFEVNAVGNEEMGSASSSEEISNDSSCLTSCESGTNVYLKNHTEDINENISEKEDSSKVHEVALTSEVKEEMFQDEANREKGREEEETTQECEPTGDTANEIPIGQIKESISKQSRHTPDAIDSEESVKVTSLEMMGYAIERSIQIPPGDPGLSLEAVSGVKQHTQVELGEARGQGSIDELDENHGMGTTTADSETSEDKEHEVESCSVLKEHSIGNTNKQKVEETELPEPYPVANSLVENKEIIKKTDEAPSMNNCLSADTDVAAEQITSEEIDEESVVPKENNKSSAPNDINSAEISEEAKDIKMASENLLSINVLDTANAKEEYSNSVVLMSMGEALKEEGHGEEQTQELSLISSKKTKQNIKSNEDNESNSKFLEHHEETVDLTEQIDTEGCQDKGQNKSPTAEFPADGTTTAEVSNNFEKSNDSPIEVLKDEDTKGKLFQDIPSFTIAMKVGEPTPDNKKEKQKMDFARSSGDVSRQKAEELDNKSVTSSEKTESNEGRHGSISPEVQVLTASEVSNVMACNKDAVQLSNTSVLVFNKETENADSQERIMCENQPVLPPCKQVSVAEKLTTGDGEVMKTTEDESHNLANFETLQNDKDEEMDVSYLPVSQYLVDRIMREEEEKTQIVVQEGIEEGHEEVHIMTKEFDISSDNHERLEEFVSQNIDGGEPNSKVSSLPVTEISVEDIKKEVFLSENLIDIVPNHDEKHATTEKNKTQSELKDGESTGHGQRTHEKSDGAAEVMEEKIILNDSKALTKNPDSPSVAEIYSDKIAEEKGPKYVEAREIQPNIQMFEEMEQKITLNDNKALNKNSDSHSVAEIDINKIPEENCPEYVEAREIQPNIQMLEEMEQNITLNDNKALTKNTDSPSVAKIDSNKMPREENCPIYVQATEIQPNIQMLEEATTEEHPPETMVTGIHENLLKTQEPPRPVQEVNQSLEDSLEFAADIKEVKIIENKHDGISDAQVEGSIEKSKLSNLGEAHPSESEKDPINHKNKIAKSLLEEKSLATNRDELNKEVIDTEVGLYETKNFNGTNETPQQTQEPSTPVWEVNQVVQDTLEFVQAEEEMKTQMNEKTQGIADAQMDSMVEEPNERAKLSDKKHPSELEKDSIIDNIQIPEGTLEENDLPINRDELDKEPTHLRRDEDSSDEEVEKDVEENEIDKSGADAPVTVETRDEGPKTTHKKPHNILSGVKSKVKHSIAKVKKAITGKSSHSKTAPTK